MSNLIKNNLGKINNLLSILLVIGIFISLLFAIPIKSEGESYGLIVFYNGTSIPSGWTCISCNPGDPFYNVSIMASSTYNTAGGSDTHQHSFLVNVGLATATGTTSLGGTYTVATEDHTHFITSSITNASNIPNSTFLKMIRYNNGVPSTLPSESIIIYNGTSIPSGWTHYNQSNGYYLRGGNGSTNLGGNNHTHLLNVILHSYVSGWFTDITGATWVSQQSHGHSPVSLNSSTELNNPSYITFSLLYTPSNVSLPDGMIGMFNSTPSGSWSVISGVSSLPYNKLLKVNNTNVWESGGNNNHSHSSISEMSGGGNVTGFAIIIGFEGVALETHQHNITVSNFNNASLMPSYKTIILGKYLQPIPPPKIQFVSPTLPNNSIVAEDYAQINITVQTNLSQSNVSSIKLDWNGTNGTYYPHLPPLCTQSGDTWNCMINKTSLSDGLYYYQAYANDTLGSWNATERRYITTGWNDVVINLFSPSDGTGTVDSNNTYHCGATSFAPIDNLTLFIWNSSGDIEYEYTVNGSFSFYLNLTQWFNFTQEGQYYWNCLGFDTDGNYSWHSTNYSILYQQQFIMIINETYNTETLESGNEPYYITLYRFDPTTNVVPEFYWDGTLDNNTIWSSQAGNYITFRVTKPLDFISPTSENHSFYWSFWYFQGGIPENLNSTNHTQTIYRMILQNNNSGGAVETLETQCMDEMTLAYINCSITDIIDTWPLTSYGEENRQRSFYFSFTNTSGNHTLYRLPDGVADFHTDTEFIASSVGYQQRTTTYTNYTLNSTQRNQTIYLLDTNSGIYVSFLVVNQMYTPLTEVNIQVEKRILGIWVPIMNGQTDESGIWTGFLDPTNLHRFTFSKSGYASKVLSIYPTQPAYTVILLTEGQGSGTLPPNYLEGINITTSPTLLPLTPGESYNFTMNISSKYWELDSYGFNLLDENDTLLASTSGYESNGSVVYVSYNCTNQTYVHMDYYFYINNSCVNFTQSWWVMQEYTGNYSIKYLFKDIQSLVGTSGLNYFTLLLIAFAITLMITAALSYTTGLYSPMALMGMITAFTWFWWFIGVIPPDINGVPGAGIIAPILMTFLLIGYSVYEHVR